MAKKITRTIEKALIVAVDAEGNKHEFESVGTGAVRCATTYVKNVLGKGAKVMSIVPSEVKMVMDEEQFIALATIVTEGGEE